MTKYGAKISREGSGLVPELVVVRRVGVCSALLSSRRIQRRDPSACGLGASSAGRLSRSRWNSAGGASNEPG